MLSYVLNLFAWVKEEEGREAIIRYDNTMRRARQEREQARADGDQARVQRLDIFIMDIMGLFDTTESYLLDYDRD